MAEVSSLWCHRPTIAHLDTPSSSESDYEMRDASCFRQYSDQTTTSTNVLIPDMSYQQDSLPSRRHNHMVDASVAHKWVLGGTDRNAPFDGSSHRHGCLAALSTHGPSSQPPPHYSHKISLKALDICKTSQKKAPTPSTSETGASLPNTDSMMDGDDDAAVEEERKVWKSAVDPKSKRTYYYNTATRETRWRKPLCLLSKQERQVEKRKEQQTRDFFAAMEANILKSMEKGGPSPKAPHEFMQQQQHQATAPLPRPHPLVRTISNMEDSVLANLIKRVPSLQGVDSFRTLSSGSFEDDNDEEDEIVSPKRRNHIMSSMSSLRGSITRLSISSAMNRVPEAEDESSSSHNADSPSFERVLPRTQGKLHLETAAIANDDSLHLIGNKHLEGEGSIHLLGLGPVRNMSAQNIRQTSTVSLSIDDVIREESEEAPSEAWHRPFRRTSTASSSYNGRQLAQENSLSIHSVLNADRSIRRADSSSFGFYSSFAADEEIAPIEELAVIAEQMSNVVASPSSLYGLAAAGVVENNDDDGYQDLEFSDDDDEPQERPKINRPQSVCVRPTLEKPSMTRRNTCGTLYVGSTMSAPDKDATIQCVCAVYRAHIIQSEREDEPTELSFPEFNDLENQRTLSQIIGRSVPSLEEITVFYRDVFDRAQMEADCIIISLIYVERLIKITNGKLRPRTSNWRSILFSCMVMSSKVWDDLSMWNADFSQTCPAGVTFPLKRVNELELAVLNALNYKVKVPASEYAKYYFLLRSMLIKSGLGSEDLTTMNPLDVEGAKQLQQVSSQYQNTALSRSNLQKAARGRSRTTGTMIPHEPNSPVSDLKVGLEHVVRYS